MDTQPYGQRPAFLLHWKRACFIGPLWSFISRWTKVYLVSRTEASQKKPSGLGKLLRTEKKSDTYSLCDRKAICLLLMASLQIRLIKILENKEKRFHLEFLKAASPWKYFKGSSWAKPWSFIQKYKPSGQCIPKKTWAGSHFLVHCQHSLSTKRLIPNRCVGIHPMNAFKGDVCHSFATITQETGKQREWSHAEAPVHLPELGCVAILWE